MTTHERDADEVRDGLVRLALAGPSAVVTAMLVDLGMPLWLPHGAADIDQIVFPLVLLPMVWVTLFFHACFDPSLKRAAIVAAALCLFNASGIIWHLGASRSGAAMVQSK